MNLEHLRTLAAVVDGGTFEAAALVLHITPSAVSQRIRALEHETGDLVVRRASPCTPSASGEILLRAARAVLLVEEETRAGLTGETTPSVVPIALNADSLATWFPSVLADAAGWDDMALRLSVVDEDNTIDLLRQGTVLAAVTSVAAPVLGCSVTPLGAMRYVPVASRAAVQSLRGRSWTSLPLVRFGADDELHLALTSRGSAPPRVHHVPSTEGCLAAIRAGLGWGAVPRLQLHAGGHDDLVVLHRRRHHDVPLYWQARRLLSARLDRLTRAVTATAAASLARIRAM